MNRNQMHILIIVHDATRRLSLRNNLSIEKYAVSVAGESWEGLRIARTSDIDLIISDLYMSNTNGFKLREAVHAMDGKGRIPFIFLAIEDDKVEKTKIALMKDCGVLRQGSNTGEIIEMIKHLTAREHGGAAEPVEDKKPAAPVPQAKAPVENPKILLVDDDDSFRMIVEDMLIEEGFKVSTAADGEIAIETLKKERFDLVLLDIFMPVVSGYGVMKFMKENSMDVKVIILTAYKDLKLAVEAKSMGASDFIAKPVMRDDLLNSIKKVLSE